ncbi:uncharacterized protein LY89DRAFT_663481 [Mollisia scopiformis]|uniref:DBF4-type domain-containing protein n=1 Tax=Mollisia scopiformis TaxID=149040 RepID=A0A194XTH6_MOLSC|nr:uncharacterized protein LY89DRAFT_663481 [Mollisia scopiformis]KUJ22997.1 hypothetical protein LY89DRAFT_663481 [Mollisia scopiformis]
MSGRRLPLSSNPNAANSPFRAVANAASKQKRSYATVQREEAYGQPPPAKKQMLASHHQDLLKTPPRQQSTQSSLEGRVYTRKSNTSQQSSFERQSAAVSEKPQQVVTKAEKTSGENLETIRAWQKHYRKIFPTFVFWFEGVPADVRTKYSKLVIELGAREEKFFSNAVTHVVTTRNIPPEHQVSAEAVTSSTNDSQSQNSQPQTINPSLLDRSSESTNAQSDFGTKAKFTFEAPGGRRLASNAQDAEVRRNQGRNADVLYKARELGMKIWAFEKLQRITRVMLEGDTSSQTSHGHNTRSNATPANNPRAGHDADLSQLLRNERIHGPSDRDPTVATKEITLFKGPFIYIHDIDERQRPIMVREYSKVANKEDGDWPQFRSVANGKCPFIEEVDYSRREVEKEKEIIRLQKQQEKEKAMVPRTRAAAAFEAAKMQPPRPVTGKRPLADLDNGSNRSASVSSRQANPFAPNKSSMALKTDPEASSRGNQNAFVSRAGAGRLFGGEPVASGLQPSNLTSAIRSQMISSTAAQPGAKAGTSKELHGLQRKVLEKNSGGPGSHGLASSHRMTDVSATARDDAPARVVKKQDKLALIEENVNPSEADENARKTEAARKVKAVQQRKLEKRDPKPGYCENCQDKFEDFEEHVLSRKHRRFAERVENWKELDSLLNQLARPLRDSQDGYDY